MSSSRSNKTCVDEPGMHSIMQNCKSAKHVDDQLTHLRVQIRPPTAAASATAAARGHDGGCRHAGSLSEWQDGRRRMRRTQRRRNRQVRHGLHESTQSALLSRVVASAVTAALREPVGQGECASCRQNVCEEGLCILTKQVHEQRSSEGQLRAVPQRARWVAHTGRASSAPQAAETARRCRRHAVRRPPASRR